MPLLFHIVLALGVVHAFLLIALLTRRISENPFGFLSLIVTLCAVTLIIIEEWVVSSGAWQRYPNILRISAWMPFLIGPGIWGFVKSLESPDLRLRYLIHFVPALFALTLFLPFYAQSGDAKIAAVMNTHSIPISVSLLAVAKAGSLFAYFIYVRVRLGQFSPSARQRKLVRYASWALNAVIVFIMIIAIAFSAEHVVKRLPVSSDLAGALGLGVFVFFFSLISIANWSDFTTQKEPPNPNRNEPQGPRVELLDDASTEAVFNEISKTVHETEMYKIAGLRMTDLAVHVGVAPHYISYVVNTVTGRNFNSWLNGLRVAAVQQDLKLNTESTLLDVAFDNGFNSKASFNRAFQQELGLSPSKYRDSLSQIIK